jgi:hypothetical protein
LGRANVRIAARDHALQMLLDQLNLIIGKTF